MFEIIIYIALQLAPWQVSVPPGENISMQPKEENICLKENATCGYLLNSKNEMVFCGDCAKHEMCSLGWPLPDGSIGMGSPFHCGGGCAPVASFTCEDGRHPTMCTSPEFPPADVCVEVGVGQWCC
jgi:hypothetical protein